MGVSAEYDDDVERRRTDPLLMPKIDCEQTSAADVKILEKVAIVAPARPPSKKLKKEILWGSQS